MRLSLLSWSAAVLLVFGLMTPPQLPAKDKSDAPAAKEDGKGPKEAPADDEFKLPPFPQDKTVKQSVQVGGRTVNYDATVGSIPVLDEKGKTVADVMFIAYTVPGANRPVTFALNGGPGASSVYLNLGAIGPKRVQFGAEGDSPSDPATPMRQPRHAGSISPTWCSSIRSAPASATRACRKTRPRSGSTTPRPTSNTCRGSSSTGWSRTSG